MTFVGACPTEKEAWGVSCVFVESQSEPRHSGTRKGLSLKLRKPQTKIRLGSEKRMRIIIVFNVVLMNPMSETIWREPRLFPSFGWYVLG